MILGMYTGLSKRKGKLFMTHYEKWVEKTIKEIEAKKMHKLSKETNATESGAKP
jgi:hypothetical protein